MTRRDYYYDPSAPVPDGLLPAVTVVVSDVDSRLLLIERVDNGLWALPGGSVDVGERVGDAAVREVLEETGLEVRICGLVGIYTDPGHVVEYAGGDVRQQFSICFHASPIGGEVVPQPSEVRSVNWYSLEESMVVPMHPSMRQRVLDHFTPSAGPRIR